MEDLTRNYLGVWKDNKFSRITSHHVATGKKGPIQVVVAVEVLCYDVGHPHGGPRVAQGVESARESNSNATSTSPYTG